MRKLSDISGKSGSLYSELQSPEFLCILGQNKSDFIAKCIDDIMSNLVLSDREYSREIAIKILMEKFDNEL